MRKCKSCIHSIVFDEWKRKSQVHRQQSALGGAQLLVIAVVHIHFLRDCRMAMTAGREGACSLSCFQVVVVDDRRRDRERKFHSLAQRGQQAGLILEHYKHQNARRHSQLPA